VISHCTTPRPCVFSTHAKVSHFLADRAGWRAGDLATALDRAMADTFPDTPRPASSTSAAAPPPAAAQASPAARTSTAQAAEWRRQKVAWFAVPADPPPSRSNRKSEAAAAALQWPAPGPAWLLIRWRCRRFPPTQGSTPTSSSRFAYFPWPALAFSPTFCYLFCSLFFFHP
jgi:hypothetical protein